MNIYKILERGMAIGFVITLFITGYKQYDNFYGVHDGDYFSTEDGLVITRVDNISTGRVYQCGIGIDVGSFCLPTHTFDDIYFYKKVNKDTYTRYWALYHQIETLRE